jgi:hypothetical protein
MITAEHARALLLAIAGDLIKEEDRETAVDGVEILESISNGSRRILSESQTKLLIEVLDTEVEGETVWSHLRRILAARMNEEAMNSECMELYLILCEMAGER